jgi:hypothetical protein
VVVHACIWRETLSLHKQKSPDAKPMQPLVYPPLPTMSSSPSPSPIDIYINRRLPLPPLHADRLVGLIASSSSIITIRSASPYVPIEAHTTMAQAQPQAQATSEVVVKCATKAMTNDKDRAAIASASAAASQGSVGSGAATPFKFNVHAPEFVPMSPAAASPMASPMSAPAGGYYSPFMQMQPGLAPADWSFFHEHEPVFFMPDLAHAKFGAATATAAGAAGSNSAQAKGAATTTDVAQKIVKQVSAVLCCIIYRYILLSAAVVYPFTLGHIHTHTG